MNNLKKKAFMAVSGETTVISLLSIIKIVENEDVTGVHIIINVPDAETVGVKIGKVGLAPFATEIDFEIGEVVLTPTNVTADLDEVINETTEYIFGIEVPLGTEEHQTTITVSLDDVVSYVQLRKHSDLGV